MNFYSVLGVVIATLTSLIAVGLHFEILEQITQWIQKRSLRGKVYLKVLCVVAAHLLEIQLFALVYYGMDLFEEFGSVTPVHSYFDYVYYSSVVYTTVGFGDVIPTGSMRVVTAIESLIGLVLITWSATFIYVTRETDKQTNQTD